MADPATQLAPGAPFHVIPAGDRAFYCFARLGVSRGATTQAPPGYDYCSGVSPEVLDARDSGMGTYRPLAMPDGATWFTVQTPIYQGGVAPSTVAARRDAFVGWAGLVLDPTVVVDRALVDHPELAAEFRYAGTTFPSTAVASGSSTHTVDLDNGWTLRTFGAVSTGGVFRNWSAFGLMAAGISVSLLLALVIVMLATGRSRALWMVERTHR